MITIKEEEGTLTGNLFAITNVEAINLVVKELVEEFPVVFSEPKELPPFRKHHDHKIQLVEGANPVNQRPYRYALHQKNEIDKIVDDVLVNGTIHSSSSPYASPMVLLKRKMEVGGYMWIIQK